MNWWSELKMYGRFLWGMQEFFRERLSLEDAKRIVQQRMAERETNFLHLIERAVLGNQRSPYLRLLKLAGCELGDIQNMVRSKGLEGTLLALREAGVYIAFEEFKGKAPIVRGGRVIPVQTQDFDNPHLKHSYYGESGGTSGAATRIPFDLDHIAATAPYMMLLRDAHGVLEAPTAIWFGVLPDTTGVKSVLGQARHGHMPQKWFTPITSQDVRPSLKYDLAARSFILVGRMLGVPIPWPEPLPLDESLVLARWALEVLKTNAACVIITHVSKALRVCTAAQEAGLNLTGVTFIAGGEPITPAKFREVQRSGARLIPGYFFTETGAVALGCAHPVDSNDLHFLKDGLALIQYPRSVLGGKMTVEPFYFTSLLPTTPKIMLNVEIDDYGIIDQRSCGCPLESYGFTEHLREIYSFSKLTGEGVTLVGSEMIRILEEVLPARFGGTPLDYQLLEEEDEQGFTRLSLLVSPRIKVVDETAVIETVLEALRKSSVAADLAQAIWRQAGTLRVKRMEPIWTARGKLMPLHLADRSQRSSSGSTGVASNSQALSQAEGRGADQDGEKKSSGGKR